MTALRHRTLISRLIGNYGVGHSKPMHALHHSIHVLRRDNMKPLPTNRRLTDICNQTGETYV